MIPPGGLARLVHMVWAFAPNDAAATRLWSTGLYFGTGGAGVSASGTTIAQGDATIGLVLKLGP